MTAEGWKTLLSGENLRFLLDGLYVTLELFFFVGILSWVLGLVLGSARFVFPSRWVSAPVTLYVAFFRNFPVLVVMLFVRFGLPMLGVDVRSAMFAAVLSFTLYNAAMISEILRGAIDTVSSGQTEAAIASGCRRITIFRHVIAPQMFRVALPGLAGQFIVLLQGTSLATAIGVNDLLHNARIVYSRGMNPLETLLLVGFVYYVLCTVLARVRDRLERSHSMS